jgi:hypothetical protein
MPQDVELGGLRQHLVESAAVYELTLRGTPPAGLPARFPSMKLHSIPAVTVLFRQVVDSTEIDGLIERLCSIGITPLEMHASSSTYEFWIEGHLGESTLRSMRWPARFEQARTVLRVSATPRDLQSILDELTDNGVEIDHLIRRNAA